MKNTPMFSFGSKSSTNQESTKIPGPGAYE